MKIEIVTVGTELLNGHKADAHGPWLGRELNQLGLQPAFHTSVADDAADLESAFRTAMSRSELVLICGGLGPTLDDISRETAAKVAGLALKEDAQLVQKMKDMAAARNIVLPPNNLRQAAVPEGATVLDNPHGTAPGLRIDSGVCTLVLLPGPPKELHAMWLASVLPWLKQKVSAPALHQRSLMVWGLGESTVDMAVKGLVPAGDTRTLAMLASSGLVEIRLSSSDAARVSSLEAAIAERLGDYLFSSDGQSLEAVVADMLSATHATVAVAESCTGGRLAAKLTAVPGSSKFFKAGFITYANEAKESLLEVPPFVLKRAGAVSKDVALAMAVGASRKTGCDFCLAVTGIAGPDGGSEEKPVGRVHLALAAPGGVAHQQFDFKGGSRGEIQARAASAALFLLYRVLAGLSIPEIASDRATLPKHSPA